MLTAPERDSYLREVFAEEGVEMPMSSNAGASSGPSARRVLLECDNPTIQDGVERVLHENGYVVSVCAGPASRSSGCDLLESGRCGLIDEAQIVVHALDPADKANREVLATLVQAQPDTPIVVETSLLAEEEPGNVRRVRFPMSRAVLLDAIRRCEAEESSVTTSAPRRDQR